MKLLFDENLSPKLPVLIKSIFPDSLHVRDCNLKGQPDHVIWEYARTHGFTIVSKDGDYYQRSIFSGAPPKLVWLRLGNCTRQKLFDLLIKNEKEIRGLESAVETVLLLS